MKEPWKKSCNGKVVITLNDEKTTTPTEVEVPVDLSWASAGHLRCHERKSSTNKTILLAATLLVLGLTIVTLFKVQNLVYSTNYMNWRMQELESAVKDANDDVKLVKYKLSLDESHEARAEALIGSPKANGLESQDLKLSESQNNRKLSNSLGAESSKESEVQNSKGQVEPERGTEPKESMDNDAREHPNPNDPIELIKPLIEILEDVSNHPLMGNNNNQRNGESNFLRNIMELLAPPPRQQELPAQDQPMNDGKIILNSIVRVQGRPIDQPAEPFDFLKKMLPDSNIKIIHFNERLPLEPQQPQQPREQQQPASLEDEMAQRLGLPSGLKIISPFDGIPKAPMPIKFFAPPEKQDQSLEEVRPKILIKSVRVKMMPLPFRDDFMGGRKNAMPMPMNPKNENIEVFRVNPESPEPSQEVEAPKMPMLPFPFNPFQAPGFIEDILRQVPPSAKKIQIIPTFMGQAPENSKQEEQVQQDELADKIIPEIHELLMKTLTAPPAEQREPVPQDNAGYGVNQEQSQEQPNVEMTKVPLTSVRIPPALMESLLPMGNYGDSMAAHVAEDATNQQQQPQEQQQQQMQEQQPPQVLPQQPQQDVVATTRTKLQPVGGPSWETPTPAQ